MKRIYDITHGVILVLILVVAVVINNSIIKGILLLLFSGVLLFNTIIKLKTKMDEKFTEKIFYGILLFIEVILALGALYTIILGIAEAV